MIKDTDADSYLNDDHLVHRVLPVKTTTQGRFQYLPIRSTKAGISVISRPSPEQQKLISPKCSRHITGI